MTHPRKRKLKVTAWASPKAGVLYLGTVRSVDLRRKNKQIQVVIENLHSSMERRLHHVNLSSSVHPGNETSLFLSACGKRADEVGREICLDDIIGVEVGMRFNPAEDNNRITFERTQHKPNTSPDQADVHTGATENLP